MFLELCLQYSPNDDLLSILEQEQLPKLKSLFDMPTKPIMRHHPNSQHQLPAQQTLASSANQIMGDSSSKLNYASKTSNILNESISSQRSFLTKLSYFVSSGDKNNAISQTSNNNSSSNLIGWLFSSFCRFSFSFNYFFFSKNFIF